MPSTPYLRLDRAVLERNVARMAEHAAYLGVTLRPHAKTHKSLEIARRQVEAEAVGLTVATIGEAEVFAAGGIGDLFIAYPLWVDGAKAARLSAVQKRARVAVGVDSTDGVDALHRHGVGVDVLVEVDSGQHRSGVTPAAAGELAEYAMGADLHVYGVFTFPGHSYAPGIRAEVAHQEAVALRQAAQALRERGIEPAVVSGGSTPSAQFADESVLTELRPGVYVFGDAQQLELGTCQVSDIALTVVATVVSHAGGRVILDSGSKALGADRAVWATGYGRLTEHLDARIVALSEHHATVEWASGAVPAIGSPVLVAPNHCCNAVNLADSYLVTGGQQPDETWSVATRGRNF